MTEPQLLGNEVMMEGSLLSGGNRGGGRGGGGEGKSSVRFGNELLTRGTGDGLLGNELLSGPHPQESGLLGNEVLGGRAGGGGGGGGGGEGGGMELLGNEVLMPGMRGPSLLGNEVRVPPPQPGSLGGILGNEVPLPGISGGGGGGRRGGGEGRKGSGLLGNEVLVQSPQLSGGGTGSGPNTGGGSAHKLLGNEVPLDSEFESQSPQGKQGSPQPLSSVPGGPKPLGNEIAINPALSYTYSPSRESRAGEREAGVEGKRGGEESGHPQDGVSRSSSPDNDLSAEADDEPTPSFSGSSGRSHHTSVHSNFDTDSRPTISTAPHPSQVSRNFASSSPPPSSSLLHQTSVGSSSVSSQLMGNEVSTDFGPVSGSRKGGEGGGSGGEGGGGSDGHEEEEKEEEEEEDEENNFDEDDDTAPGEDVSTCMYMCLHVCILCVCLCDAYINVFPCG